LVGIPGVHGHLDGLQPRAEQQHRATKPQDPPQRRWTIAVHGAALALQVAARPAHLARHVSDRRPCRQAAGDMAQQRK